MLPRIDPILRSSFASNGFRFARSITAISSGGTSAAFRRNFHYLRTINSFGTERQRTARFSILNDRTILPNTAEMPHAIDVYCPQVTTFATNVAKNPSINSTYEYVGKTPLLNALTEPLAPKLRSYIEECAALCCPKDIYICDGSDAEYNHLLKLLERSGTITRLPKYENCWLARTNPADVARVEKRTFISTESKRDVVPSTRDGVVGTLGNWISPTDMDKAILERFPGCMRDRTMYVIPFSMGPMGSPLSKIGIEITDSAYVVCSMRIMTRMGKRVLDILGNDDFVKCLHSIGVPPSDSKIDVNHSWPCDPERTIILHKPATNEIVSYGSGYGGNSLLGKKCFALRIGSTIARSEGWLAEHMLILGITNPKGKKRYIAAAFPSACGKTNLAMMQPTLPGYKVECVGDDIAWISFDQNGRLRAINPEYGFFGVAPGTSTVTNPNAMKTIFKNTIFTNVAATSDGGVYWEGLEEEISDDVEITDWRGNKWTKGSKTPAAHPNSRFCTPATQCPIIDPSWEDPAGVPIDAILFGGRRPEGVPLIYQARNWQHGVFIGASMRSEATAAAEYQGKVIMNDPFAMRPFFGYNFGQYLDHWLSLAKVQNAKLPAIFHVNWFRKNAEGKYLWPGYGENSRVLDWILRRIDGEDVAVDSPIGFLPKLESFNFENLQTKIDMQELFRIPKSFWQKEVEDLKEYFDAQVGDDLPSTIRAELDQLARNIEQLK